MFVSQGIGTRPVSNYFDISQTNICYTISNKKMKNWEIIFQYVVNLSNLNLPRLQLPNEIVKWVLHCKLGNLKLTSANAIFM